jgi:hypothetical protein
LDFNGGVIGARYLESALALKLAQKLARSYRPHFLKARLIAERGHVHGAMIGRN